MAFPSYTKVGWRLNDSPWLDDTNLNHMDDQIKALTDELLAAYGKDANNGVAGIGSDGKLSKASIVKTDNITDGAVTTAKITDANVTLAKLASGCFDVANGAAKLDSAGNVLGLGSKLLLARDASNNIYLQERTSGEQPLYLKRVGASDYDLYLRDDGSWSLLTKNVANGVAGLNGLTELEPYAMLCSGTSYWRDEMEYVDETAMSHFYNILKVGSGSIASVSLYTGFGIMRLLTGANSGDSIKIYSNMCAHFNYSPRFACRLNNLDNVWDGNDVTILVGLARGGDIQANSGCYSLMFEIDLASSSNIRLRKVHDGTVTYYDTGIAFSKTAWQYQKLVYHYKTSTDTLSVYIGGVSVLTINLGWNAGDENYGYMRPVLYIKTNSNNARRIGVDTMAVSQQI